MLRFLSFLILKDSTTDAKGETGAVIAGGGREADKTLPSRTGRNPAAVLKEEDISAGSEDLHSWKAEGAAEGKKKKHEMRNRLTFRGTGCPGSGRKMSPDK